MESLLVLDQHLPLGGLAPTLPPPCTRQSQPALSHRHLPHWLELSRLILLMVDKRACLRTIIHFSRQVYCCAYRQCRYSTAAQAELSLHWHTFHIPSRQQFWDCWRQNRSCWALPPRSCQISFFNCLYIWPLSIPQQSGRNNTHLRQYNHNLHRDLYVLPKSKQ